eukprot:5418472-Pyramimonas_sp.AAC.1
MCIRDRIGTALSCCKLPHCFGGGWNVSPQRLSDSGQCDRLQARLIVPTEGTYRDPKSGKRSLLDYWMASDSIASSSTAPGTLADFPPRNHYAVMTSILGGVRSHAVTVLSGPGPFPVQMKAKLQTTDDDDDGELSFDISRGQPDMPWTDLMAADSVHRLGQHGDHRYRLDQLSRALYDGAEAELAPLFQPPEGGHDRVVGRSRRPRYRKSTSGGALARCQPSGAQASRAISILQLRVHDISIARNGSLNESRAWGFL